MKSLRLVLVLVFLFKIISVTYGWGKVGHNIVAEIAKTYVSKSIQDSVNKYLGVMTWDSASTWMDEMRGKYQYNFMKSWHYINIEKGMKYADTIAKGNNVVKQLQTAINNLMNRSKLTKEEINFNLKVLFHLMGDLHQPLHVGYGSDKGGNDIKVKFNGKTVNLHHIWDDDIIEYKNLTFTNVLNLYKKLSKNKIINISAGDAIKWLNQNRKLLGKVYSYTNPVQDKYIKKSYKIIENQLLYAGIRLGKILDDVFKK